MQSENIILGVTLIFSGASLALLCVPLLRGAVKPNPFYGMRFPKSFESEENWFKINRYGARQFIMWSMGLIGLGVLAFFVPPQSNSAFGACLTAGVLLTVLVPTLQVYRYSKTL
jgi:uncharacterized membrane protein